MKRTGNVLRGFTSRIILAVLGVVGQGTVPSNAADLTYPNVASGVDKLEQLRSFHIEEITVPPTAEPTLTVPLSLDGVPFAMHLNLHSLRTEAFRLLVQDDSGQVRLVRAPTARTYRGRVEGLENTRVAASVADGQLSAIILFEDGSRWYVEPIAEPAGVRSGRRRHVVYRGEDVVQQPRRCGVGDARAWSHSATAGDNVVAAPTGPTRICDIAFDADVEFFLSNGGSVAQTVHDIEGVLNGVSLLYESELNITYELTAIVIRTAEPDPYTSSDFASLLLEFRNEWNVHMLGVHRDIAHLMTGKDVDDAVIGTAYAGVMCEVCAGADGYGFSQSRFSPLMSERICLTAHELGHNWGAPHCDGESDCGVMCAMLGGCAGTCTRFGQTSLATIEAAAASAPCLATLAPPMQFPLCETFEFGLNNATWSYNAAASLSTDALNPPSPPHVLRIDNCCTECAEAPDEIRTNFISLADLAEATLAYHTEHAGGPLTWGSQLVVEYWSNDQSWVELNRIVSDGVDQAAFDPWVHRLPADALHAEARLRLRLEGVSDADVWYVDDVALLRAMPDTPILYVRQDATPNGGGMSWDDAYDDLQHALLAATCAGGAAEEIWVSSGTYKPDRGTGDRSSTFRLLNGVDLLGGFSGTETKASDRRPEINVTVLSGDIGLPGIPSDNVYHVVTGGGTDATAVLDGFTVTDGRAMAAPNDGGGGLRVAGGSPSISHSVFSANAGNNGGGVYVGANSGLNLTECTIIENRASSHGSGLYVASGASSYIDRCLFLGNTASAFGGGIYSANGRLELKNTAFAGNAASSGAGIYNWLGALTAHNCTLANNTATASVGGILNSNGAVSVTSSILWGNRDNGGTLQSSQIGGASPTVNYTCIQGYTGSLGGVGNNGTDPLLVDPDGMDNVPGTVDDELQPAPGSAAVDSGDPASDPVLLGAVDLGGHPRILCGRVDMGAFEFGVGDYDCDRTVNLSDFSNWSGCMTGPGAASVPPSCAAFDFNVDSHVDLLDFAGFQSVFSDP